MEALIPSLLIFSVLLGVGAIVLLFSSRRSEAAQAVRFEQLERGQERSERMLRDELARLRDELQGAARDDRAELRASLTQLSEGVRATLDDAARLQREQLELFGGQIAHLSGNNQQQFQVLRETVERRLQLVQEDNTRQLGEMRSIVEEKLQGALEKRLGESFSQVSQQLEQVYKGLGEMQTLALGVGDLKRVLSNVKARGGWGEVMLANLLADTLTPDQYEQNVKTREGSRDLVEFVIKLPGRSPYDEPVLLPVDSKFPLEDYERLVRAVEAGDLTGAEEAGKALEQRVKVFAKDIRDKYLDPPRTTDFGIMFIPSEGLFAEIVRRATLVEALRREQQVVIAGPTTFAALLNSLQMGFRTLAVEKRSGEVWRLLGAVKTEFGRFGTVLDAVKKKLDEAGNTIDKASQRTRVIERKLKQVEVVSTSEAQQLLPEDEGAPSETTDELHVE